MCGCISVCAKDKKVGHLSSALWSVMQFVEFRKKKQDII